ncbi:MAG: hypothetical protein AAF828_07045 [Bacteroidota bacterium]
MSNPSEDKKSSIEPEDVSSKTAREGVKNFQEKVKAVDEKVASTIQSEGFIKVFTWLKSRVVGMKNLTLEVVENWVKNFFSIVIRGLSGLVVLLLLIGSVQGILDDNYIFGEFSVPSSMEEIGISSEVLKNRIMYKANTLPSEISRDTTSAEDETDKTYAFLAETNVPEEDIKVMDVSLSSVRGMIRRVLGRKNTNIDGDLIYSDGELTLTLRINEHEENGSIKVETSTARGCEGRTMVCLDSLIEKSAFHILALEEPLLIAFYYYRIGQSDKAEDIIEVLLGRDTSHYDIDLTEFDEQQLRERAEAYNMWGEILYSKGITNGKTQPIKQKFHIAYKLDPQLAAPWINWGDVVLEENRDSLQAIFNRWRDSGRQPIPTKKYRKYRHQLKRVVDHYEQGQRIVDSLQQTSRLANQIVTISSANYAEAMLYQAMFTQDTSINYVKLVNELESDLLGADFAAYQASVQELFDSKRFEYGAILYLSYLKQVRRNRRSERYDALLYESVPADHPFLLIFREAYRLHRSKDISDELFHQILEQLAYFQKVFYIFDLDALDFEPANSPTLVYEAEDETEEDPVYWSDINITPDPSLSSGRLDSTSTTLWYYLFDAFDTDNYLNAQANTFTEREDYRQLLREFEAQRLPSFYLEQHDIDYAEAKDFLAQFKLENTDETEY